MRKVFIIAEAGVNHNGSIRIARKMVDIAASCGADAVKFQTFCAGAVASKYAPKAGYQKMAAGRSGGGQLDMLKKLELDAAAHRELLSYCRKKGIVFISSPFDLDSVELLARMGLKILKIPSGEITNLPYLRKIGSLGKKLIISTGISTLKEVKDALDILVKSGARKRDITVLHCNSEYPTPFGDANLTAMLTMKNALGVKTGYSDHTQGIEAAIAAAALGASVIEKHFTLDKNMNGPDHKASLDPAELNAMVKAIRNVEVALGAGVKEPSSSEFKNLSMIRKSIVASRPIRRGEILTRDNLAVKRPGTGISPMKWDKVLGRRAKRDFKSDEALKI